MFKTLVVALVKKTLLFFVFLASFSCSKTKLVELKFLDEYVLADSISFNNTIVGGLSGIDYANGFYYLVVDDTKNPRFIKSKITIKNDKIIAVNFKNIVSLNDTVNTFYKENALDLESVFVDEQTQEIYFVSEGSIKKKLFPTVFKTDSLGGFVDSFQLPKDLLNLENIKHNAAFEASSKSIDKKGFWAAMEAPLQLDGDEPIFKKTSSPIRITYFNKDSKNATKQFAYQLENITKPAKGNINLNGVTAILEYTKNHFFVIERTYQNGYGSYGNIVRIFEATINENTTNIIDFTSLKASKFIPLKKRLLFNFEMVKNKLTEGIVDNIEGITFGPKLANGNQSLMLVSDDNFQMYGKQLNQFILLEITTN